MQPTEAMIREATMMKGHYPFYHVCLVIEPSGEYYFIAKPTMRQANDAARKGCAVYKIAA
jgi:hypothetical protein